MLHDALERKSNTTSKETLTAKEQWFNIKKTE
jgi:hypothetical protein